MNDIRSQAAGIITKRKVDMLEQEGLCIVPKFLIKGLVHLEKEEILWIEGKAIYCRPATSDDTEKILRDDDT